MSENVSVDHPFIKSATALGAAGTAQAINAADQSHAVIISFLPLNSWADMAALFAAIYTGCLWAEFMWRKFLRPFGEKHCGLKKHFRRKTDQQFHDKWGI